MYILSTEHSGTRTAIIVSATVSFAALVIVILTIFWKRRQSSLRMKRITDSDNNNRYLSIPNSHAAAWSPFIHVSHTAPTPTANEKERQERVSLRSNAAIYSRTSVLASTAPNELDGPHVQVTDPSTYPIHPHCNTRSQVCI